MSTPTVYVLCDCHNKYESMTKEQIITAIEQALQSGSVGNVDTGFITKIKEQNSGVEFMIWLGTTAEYNALATKDANTLYILTDDDTADALDTLNDTVQDIIDGTQQVGRANTADSATEATHAGAANTAGILTHDGYTEGDNGVLSIGDTSEVNGIYALIGYDTTYDYYYSVLMAHRCELYAFHSAVGRCEDNSNIMLRFTIEPDGTINYEYCTSGSTTWTLVPNATVSYKRISITQEPI